MKKITFAIIAILCVACMVFAFAACQPTDEKQPDANPSGQPSGSINSGNITPSGSVDSGEVIPSGSVNSGEVTSGDINSGEQIPSGSISSGEIPSGEIGSGEQEQPITNEDIIQALDANCAISMISRCFLGMNINLDNISNTNWYVIKDEDGNITGAEYSCNYQSSSSNSYFALGKVVFETSISEKDLLDGEIGNATYSRVYRMNFDHNIQEDRADLKNAICDKLFGENENAIRYIVDNGNTANDSKLGTARMFTVVEIADNGVKETAINLKTSSSDTEYITRLENEANYRITSEKSYTISGELITK